MILHKPHIRTPKLSFAYLRLKRAIEIRTVAHQLIMGDSRSLQGELQSQTPNFVTKTKLNLLSLTIVD